MNELFNKLIDYAKGYGESITVFAALILSVVFFLCGFLSKKLMIKKSRLTIYLRKESP